MDYTGISQNYDSLTVRLRNPQVKPYSVGCGVVVVGVGRLRIGVHLSVPLGTATVVYRLNGRGTVRIFEVAIIRIVRRRLKTVVSHPTVKGVMVRPPLTRIRTRRHIASGIDP